MCYNAYELSILYPIPRLRGVGCCIKGEKTALNSRTQRFSTRFSVLAFGLLTAVLLTGCEGQKIVARVNTVPITEEQFFKRTVRVTPNELPQNANLDAGSVTLINMVVEKITEQYAADKNMLPSKDEVNRTVEYLRKSRPAVRAALKSGRIDQDDIVRVVRTVMLNVAIGTNGAGADKAKLEALYKQRVAELTVPESYIVLMLPVTDEATGNKVLEELKRNPSDFYTAARVAGIPPMVATTAGQETPLPLKNLDAATKAELEKIKPGAFCEKPLKITFTSPPQTVTAVLKMVGKEKEYTPTLDDVKFQLTQEVVTQTQPQWQQFMNQQLAEATKKADIQINIERYKYLADIIRAQAEQNAQGAMPTMTPPTSGGTAAPPSGTPPPSSGGASSSSGAPPPTGSGSAPAPSGSEGR